MKPITFQIRIECQDDIPDHIIEWMASSLAGHVENEFGLEYESDWTDPSYDDRPLAGQVQVWRMHGRRPPTADGARHSSDHLMQLLVEAI